MSGQKDNVFSSMTTTLNEPRSEEMNKLASTLWKAFNGTGQKKQPDEFRHNLKNCLSRILSIF